MKLTSPLHKQIFELRSIKAADTDALLDESHLKVGFCVLDWYDSISSHCLPHDVEFMNSFCTRFHNVE